MITMREFCMCGSIEGYIVEKGGQDTVRCLSCNQWQYNAPRTETGKAQRSVSTVHEAIKPKQRARVLMRASGFCELCGAKGIQHVGHLISVEHGLAQGLTERELNDDENLASMCEECNLGLGAETVPLRLAISILKARTA